MSFLYNMAVVPQIKRTLDEPPTRNRIPKEQCESMERYLKSMLNENTEEMQDIREWV